MIWKISLQSGPGRFNSFTDRQGSAEKRRRGLRVSQLARGLENRGAEDAELWTHRAGHGAPEPPHPPGRGGADQGGEKTWFCSTALSKGNKFQEEKWKINVKINHQVQPSV